MAQPRLGFIGLGMMGAAMASRLQSGGYSLAVFNRTREKALPLIERGAIWCSSPAAVATNSTLIFSMVSNSEALEEIALGPSGLLSRARTGLIHVDCSTVSPRTTERLSSTYRNHNAVFLHCPVLGSVSQAAEGTLLLFAGGPEEGYSRVEPVLRRLGGPIWRFDEPPLASHAKLVCNLFIAGMITTLGQAFALAQKSGVAPSTILDILQHSTLNAPMYQAKGNSILEGNFNPRFFLEHMLKDITLILEAGKRLGLSLPGIEASQHLYREAVDGGLGKEDYSAVVKVLMGDTPSRM